MNYDLIVVGSGFCGSVIARLAAEQDKKVLIIEKRNHIAGNMYDRVDDSTGIIIQKYGPHIFHTESEEIYNFVTRFDNWYPFTTFYGVEINGQCISAPFGFAAIDKLYEPEEASDLKQRLMEHYPYQESVMILDLLESSDDKIHDFAEFLYSNNYYPYALKQWDLKPSQLDRSVIGRMPIILSDRLNYYKVKHEMLPESGFTGFFSKMLSHSNIDIVLNTDAWDVLKISLDGNILYEGETFNGTVVYTGPLEDVYGEEILPYRSLSFDIKHFVQASYQEKVIVTYPLNVPYIRTTEYKKLMRNAEDIEGTLVAFEYPVPYKKNGDVVSEARTRDICRYKKFAV